MTNVPADSFATKDVPSALMRQTLLDRELVRAVDRPVVRLLPWLKIVAIGSSSTEGAGGSVPYPRLLELALKHRLPDVPITVLNRGKGGEEAGEELARFETDVISADPNLVIWQVGTNAVWKPVYDLDQVGRAIQAGLALLNHRNTDIIIMDPQYAPAVLQQPLRAERMVRIIAELAAQASANVFTRFALTE